MLLDSVLSVMTGGLTGLLGAGIQKYSEQQTKKLELEALKLKNGHDLEMRRMDIEADKVAWEQRKEIKGIEGATAIGIEDAKAFAVSQEKEHNLLAGQKLNSLQVWFMVLLEFVRGMIRPGLTIYLCAITTLMSYQAYMILRHLNAAIEAKDAMLVMREIVSTILYLTTTCVTWWFGVRTQAPRSK